MCVGSVIKSSAMADLEWINRLLRKDNAITQKLVLSESMKLGGFFAKLISFSCDSWYWMVALLAIWLFGREPWRERAFLLALAIGFLAVGVLSIKYLVRRQRPEGEWGRVYRALDPHSFPSGHAARALCIALLVCFFGLGWAGFGLLVWAALVGWSRISLRLHFLVDVVAGWLIGAIAARVTIMFYPVLQVLHGWILNIIAKVI